MKIGLAINPMILFAYVLFVSAMVAPGVIYLGCLVFLPDRDELISTGDSNTRVVVKSVSAIIACNNEEEHIERKIREVIEQLMTAGIESYEVIVVSDGSTDNSNQILRELAKGSVCRLIEIKERQGKANALNKAIAESQYPILLLCDVRQTFATGSVKALLCRLEDPKIGAVTGLLELSETKLAARSWANRLKIMESRKGSTSGMIGALYVIRKNLTEFIPVDTILDDLLMGLHVMKHGKRIVVEPSAIISDFGFTDFYTNRRQGRITAGLLQILKHHRRELSQIGRLQLLFLFGQKYYKYAIPFLLALASITAIFSSPLFFWHYGVLLIVFLFAMFINPTLIRQLVKLVGGYVVQLARVGSYGSEKWKR